MNRKTETPKKRKRILLLLAALAVLGVSVLMAGFTLSRQDIAGTRNDVEGVNEDRSQVLLTGTDYSLNYEQEQEHLEEREKEKESNEKKQEKAEEQQSKVEKPETPPENIVEKEEKKREEEKKEEQSKPEEKKEEQTKPEDKKEEETKPEEKKEEQTKPEDKKEEQTKPEEKKEEQTKPEDKKEEQTKPEDKKEEQTKPEEKPGDSGTDDPGTGPSETPSENPGGEETPGETPGPGGDDSQGDVEPGTGGGDNPGEGEGGENPSENPEEPEEINKNPIIECSLTDGELINSDTVSFTVRGLDYHRRPINSFYITVNVNGSRISSGGYTSDGGYTYYADLNDGANEIAISVSDEEGNTSNVVYSLSADSESEELTDETVNLVLDLRSIGYGVPINTWEQIYSGESLPHFVDRVLNEYGYSPYSRKPFNSGYYLERIYGINVSADSVNIPDVILEYIDDFNPSSMGLSSGSLGQDDVYEKSGWMYMYNGEIRNQGMSSVSLMDGDEVVLMFTVHMGYEYDGTWFYYGDW